MNKTIRNTLLTLVLLAACVCNAAYSQDNNAKEQAREHYLRGNILYQEGKYKEAEEEFQKSLDLLTEKEGAPVQTVAPGPQEKIPSAPAVPKPQGRLEYIIGEEDVLQISVWQNQDLSQEVIVRPDGAISYPLIGDIQAAGLTITELDKQITEKLKEYVKYPEVSISIRKLGGQKVIVLGEVASPGVYSVTGAKSILEAISLAGGFGKDAVTSSVVLIRGGFGSPRPQRINLSRALTGDIRQNVTLQSEDVVFVPKKFIANLNYFLNQVLDPLSKGMYTAKSLQMY